jgi:hypothetical protein
MQRLSCDNAACNVFNLIFDAHNLIFFHGRARATSPDAPRLSERDDVIQMLPLPKFWCSNRLGLAFCSVFDTSPPTAFQNKKTQTEYIMACEISSTAQVDLCKPFQKTLLLRHFKPRETA